MSVNAEVLLRSHLQDDPDLPNAYMDTPPDRPARFVTVERIGGAEIDVRDFPVLAVQCWDVSRHAASELANSVKESVVRLRAHPNVGRVVIDGCYNFPDLDSGTARYQVVVAMVTVD